MFKRLLLTLALAILCANAHAQTATQIPLAKSCFTGSVGTSGVISTLGFYNAGSGGVAGTYSAPLLGGTGSGATATLVVSGGAIVSQTLSNPGTGYVVGDTLTASPAAIGGVLGYSTTVAGTAISGALAGGSVAFYTPGTTTPKQTWQDSAQAILNTNPVALDGNGCALIYGVGAYRQVVKDSLGNTVWDQVTSTISPSGNIALANGKILVGNSSGVAAPVTVSGDCTLSNTGVTTCAGGLNYINAMAAPYNVKNTDEQGNCAANLLGLTAAKNAAIQKGVPLYLGYGTIHTNAISWDLTSVAASGFHMFGAGIYLTTLDSRTSVNDSSCVPNPLNAGLHLYAADGNGFNFGQFENFSVLSDFDGASCELGQASNIDPFNYAAISNVACRNNNSVSPFHSGAGCLFHFVLNSVMNGLQCTAYANQSNYAQTNSVTNVTIGTGSKTFVVTVPGGGLNWVPGQFVTAFVSDKPTTHWMEGTVTSYSAGTLVMNVTAVGADGSGASSTNWTVHADGTMYGTAMTCTQCQFNVFNGGSFGNASVAFNIPVGAFTQAQVFNATDFENCNYCFYNQSSNAHAITMTGVRASLWTQFMAYSSDAFQSQAIKWVNPTLGSPATQFNTSSAANASARGLELNNGEPVWAPNPPMPATGVPWYNYTAKPLNVILYPNGATISATSITSIINGSPQTVGYPAGGNSFILGPNDYITVTYSAGTPAWAMRIVQ